MGQLSTPPVHAEPMQYESPVNVPLGSRSPRRRISVSPSQSSASHRRGLQKMICLHILPPFVLDRSPPDRSESLRSHSPARSGRRSSPRSRSRVGRAISHTRSFNSRRPSLRSFSRSPPPSASYSNDFRPRSSRRSRSRSAVRDLPRGRTFSGPHPPRRSRSRSRSPLLNSRHALEKRPFVRSPSPLRGVEETV
ncbi:hypothetical protein B0H13DRAFT_968511 [Mycena leptocephala]|nr:hypothetical protein B0H13DRAFT_968511 [Mycena leptocephala]